MRIIPVIDLMGGQVVRGIAGNRHEYRPIQSLLAPDARPASIGCALADRGFREIYVADLDAIAGAPPALAIYEELTACGLSLWLDAGLADLERTRELAELTPAGRPIAGIIAGLESLPDIDLLAAMSRLVGRERLIFSLDLKYGRPITSVPTWQELAPLEIADLALGCGIERVIVLDLARVGVGQGIGTENICRELRARFPQLEIISGGGVRDRDDLARLEAAGCDAALVASALHDGRLNVDVITP